MKLTNLKIIGRYTDTRTGKSYNIKEGRNTERSTHHLFYTISGKRVYISDYEFKYFKNA